MRLHFTYLLSKSAYLFIYLKNNSAIKKILIVLMFFTDSVFEQKKRQET